VDTLRLADGVLFPMPITLDLSREDVGRLSVEPGIRIALRDPRDDEALAIITGSHHQRSCSHLALTYLLVEDIYTPDRVKEAIKVFGADDPAHPSVAYLRRKVKDLYIGGKVQAIQAPTHFDYVTLRCKHFPYLRG